MTKALSLRTHVWFAGYQLAWGCECLPCLARFSGCVLSISTSNMKCDSRGLWEDQGGSWSRKPTRKPWLPGTCRAFSPAGRFCPCLDHAHEDPVVANHADCALSPFHQVQTEREEEKKNPRVFETNSNKSCCSDCGRVTYLTGSLPRALQGTVLLFLGCCDAWGTSAPLQSLPGVKHGQNKDQAMPV